MARSGALVTDDSVSTHFCCLESPLHAQTLRMCHITGFCHTYNNDDWRHFIYIYKYTRRVRTHKYGFGEEWPSCPAPADLTQREKKWAWLTVVLTWPADPPTRCIRAINTLTDLWPLSLHAFHSEKIPYCVSIPTNSAVFVFHRLSWWWNRRDFLAGQKNLLNVILIVYYQPQR
jgi:hypothetical protein